MKTYIIKNKTGVPSSVSSQLKLLQPEIISLLSNTPKFGIATFKIHFMNGEIKRVISKRAESVNFNKGEKTC